MLLRSNIGVICQGSIDMNSTFHKVFVATVIISVVVMLPRQAAAHCDSMDGPVVTAAKLALDTADVAPVLKWVRKDDEQRIRGAFDRTLKVRSLSPEAREIADTYFFETLVRVHRAGEGEPYTGLKPAGTEVEPGIALADKALQAGSADELVKQVTAEVASSIRQRFARVQQASKRADQSVDAGREYVAAYVEYIHYVENMHQALKGPTSHAEHAAELAEGNHTSPEQ
jgi:Family of unknown function (DUF6448)